MENLNDVDWNVYAREYDVLMELLPYRAMLSAVADVIAQSGATRLLDASTGTGNLLNFMPTAMSKAAVGVDMADAMLDRAREKHPHTRFLKSDLNGRLPFEDEVFEAVVSVNTLYATTNPAATLREFRRILNSTGQLILVTPKQGYENGLILKSHCQSQKSDRHWLGIHQETVREEALVREAIQDERLVEKMLFIAQINRLIAKSAVFHFLTEKQLEERMTEAGWRITGHRYVYADQCHMVTAKKD